MKNKRVLVFAPHHDDEAVGMGGTIAKLTKEGCEVSLAVVCRGTFGIDKKNPSQTQKMREKETLDSAKVLKIKNVKFMRLFEYVLEFNDQTLSKFVRVIRKDMPDVVYVPHDKEQDIDHRRVCQIVKEAIWLSRISSAFGYIKPMLEKDIQLKYYEVWTPMSQVTDKICIDKYILQKQKAISCYKSQLKERNYLKMAISLNRFRAISCLKECNFLEVFS